MKKALELNGGLEKELYKCKRCGSFDVIKFNGQTRVPYYQDGIEKTKVFHDGTFSEELLRMEYWDIILPFPICERCIYSLKFWLSNQ
jgi:hypothetical protein